MIIGAIVGAIWMIGSVASDSTPENLRFCRQVALCREYAQARQDCAVAGDFDTCVTVKIADDDVGDVDMEKCNNDGSLRFTSAPNSPSELECAGINIGARLNSLSKKQSHTAQ
ncbi:hypothetical protein CWB41_04610 [Methylovirgula ligni]|nr:hypothetical protein CWB41_04610 [Methylovirgula ligni]